MRVFVCVPTESTNENDSGVADNSTEAEDDNDSKADNDSKENDADADSKESDNDEKDSSKADDDDDDDDQVSKTSIWDKTYYSLLNIFLIKLFFYKDSKENNDSKEQAASKEDDKDDDDDDDDGKSNEADDKDSKEQAASKEGSVEQDDNEDSGEAASKEQRASGEFRDPTFGVRNERNVLAKVQVFLEIVWIYKNTIFSLQWFVIDPCEIDDTVDSGEATSNEEIATSGEFGMYRKRFQPNSIFHFLELELHSISAFLHEHWMHLLFIWSRFKRSYLD